MSDLTLIELLTAVLGELPYGLTFMYPLIGGLLLVFMFFLLDKLFEIIFSRFFK